ncbi:phosphotransferase [Streptomyces sp. NRRL S-237]|uniref:phosphotransferase n=1 Tax=Streptomyces sp. NRRL S-237 TaxID=1463895 RepID=UPI00069187C6|nr:phosphotransferase [Streptomyces sp. NRRL S-237]
MPTVSLLAPLAPTAADLFAYADRQITDAAITQWPDSWVGMGTRVPSPTGYVRRICVGNRHVYAKYSVLGTSLVSLLRGACGDWPAVHAAQERYVRSGESLMRREAAQISFLARNRGPRPAQFEGLQAGVLFTAPVTGTPLSQLLLADPGRTAELLDLAFRELAPLHRSRASVSGLAGVERSIMGTFQRKFGRPHAAHAYLAELVGRTEDGGGPDVLPRVVRRLLKPTSLPNPAPNSVLCYGDLKPEHILLPPDDPTARPRFIDPGLVFAHPHTDLAKFVMRTVLFLIATRPAPAVTEQILGGLAEHLDNQLRGASTYDQLMLLRQILTWMLMDAVNIMSTYLAAPSSLPLPPSGEALAARSGPVLVALDRVTADLEQDTPVRTMWESALSEFKAAAA